MAPKTPKPKWKLADAQSSGQQALALALEQRTLVEPRLAAGVIDGLTADLATLDGKRSETTRAPELLRAATRTQNEVNSHALELLGAARGALARTRCTAAERAAFGLSLKLESKKIATTLAGLDALVAGAAKFPAVARAASLLPADLESAAALRSALTTADGAQEQTKKTRTAPKAERDVAQLHVEAAVDSIVAAGLLASVGNPALGARFRALIPTKATRKPKVVPPQP
jgi:hypothetical protein